MKKNCYQQLTLFDREEINLMNNQIEDEAAAKCTSNKSKPKHHNPYLLQYRRSSYSAHECNIVLPPIYIKPRTLSTMLTYYDQEQIDTTNIPKIYELCHELTDNLERNDQQKYLQREMNMYKLKREFDSVDPVICEETKCRKKAITVTVAEKRPRIKSKITLLKCLTPIDFNQPFTCSSLCTKCPQPTDGCTLKGKIKVTRRVR